MELLLWPHMQFSKKAVPVDMEGVGIIQRVTAYRGDCGKIGRVSGVTHSALDVVNKPS